MALSGTSGIRDATTLTIESTDVRYLVTKGGKVERWGSVPIPAGLISEGLPTSAVELGKIVDELFGAEKLDRKRVIVGISGMRSIPRLLTLPKLQASLLEEAISREARKEMPISLDDLYLSWQSMPATGDHQNVYVVGVPREMIDGHIRLLEVAGIAPRSMDLKPLALIRALQKEEAIIVDLERDELNLVLVVNYLPAIMRSFTLQAEQLEQDKLDRLVGELTQTVRFYNDSHRNAPIKPATAVNVTGQMLENRELCNLLQSMLDRQIERSRSPLPAPEGFAPMPYMVNLGLALKKR